MWNLASNKNPNPFLLCGHSKLISYSYYLQILFNLISPSFLWCLLFFSSLLLIVAVTIFSGILLLLTLSVYHYHLNLRDFTTFPLSPYLSYSPAFVDHKCFFQSSFGILLSSVMLLQSSKECFLKPSPFFLLCVCNKWGVSTFNLHFAVTCNLAQQNDSFLCHSVTCRGTMWAKPSLLYPQNGNACLSTR